MALALPSLPWLRNWPALLLVAVCAAAVAGIAVAPPGLHPVALLLAGASAGACLCVGWQQSRLSDDSISLLAHQLDRAEVLARFCTYTLHMSSQGHIAGTWSPYLGRMLNQLDASPGCIDEFIALHVHPEDKERVLAASRYVLETHDSSSIEYRLQRADGSVVYVQDHVEYAGAKNGVDIAFGQLHDVTGRKLVEQERLEAAARFQAFVEQLGGMSYIACLDRQATNIHVSAKVTSLLGFTQAQWCADPGFRLRQMHETDRERYLHALAATIDTGSPLSIDYCIRHADESLRWFHDEARVATDATGRPLFLHGVMLDITERKHAQEELLRSHTDLKRLVGALDAVREDEQKRLAREMHDELGQLLAAMKMDLSALAHQLSPEDRHVLQRVDGINELVNSMLVAVRRIIADLPPKLLDDFGLADSLKLLVRNFEKRYGIACKLQMQHQGLDLHGKLASMVYRLVQESLTNVAKHAGAKHVGIAMGVSGAMLTMSIEDDGRGASATDLAKAGSFGLACMRERVESFDGVLDIVTAPGCGMKIVIALPLHHVQAGSTRHALAKAHART